MVSKGEKMRLIDGDALKEAMETRLEWAEENYDRRDLICRGYIEGLEVGIREIEEALSIGEEDE